MLRPRSVPPAAQNVPTGTDVPSLRSQLYQRFHRNTRSSLFRTATFITNVSQSYTIIDAFSRILTSRRYPDTFHCECPSDGDSFRGN